MAVICGLDHVHRMAVGGVDAEEIDVLRDQPLGSFVVVGPDRAADAQPPAVVAAGVGKLLQLVDVFDGDHAAKAPFVVDQKQLLDLVLLEDLLGVVEGRCERGGDQVVLRHHVADLHGRVGLEPEVAACEDAGELAVFDDGHARDVVRVHQIDRAPDRLVGRQRHRVDDDAVGRPFDRVDLADLVVDVEVAMDDADSALLRERDGQGRLCHGVHRGRAQRDVERDLSRQPRACPDLGGQNIGLLWYEVHIVECDAAFKHIHSASRLHMVCACCGEGCLRVISELQQALAGLSINESSTRRPASQPETNGVSVARIV
jgi:hypothetical protein